LKALKWGDRAHTAGETITILTGTTRRNE